MRWPLHEMGKNHFRTYFWTRKIPCTWTKVNSDLLARLKLYDMRWPLHGMGKIFQNLLLDKENSLHMNRGKLWPTCKAWVIWYEVAFTWDWKRISFQNLLVEKDNCFSLQKNLHETQVSLMCHVLWHDPYDTLRSQEPSEGKFYQFTKKLVNKGCCFAGTICDTVDLWLATFFLIEKGFDEIRINLWLAWKDTPQKSFWYPQATSHVILWNCLIMWQKKEIAFFK